MTEKKTEKAKDPCNGCDGTNCPLLEEAGITCMGIEGLKIIPSCDEKKQMR